MPELVSSDLSQLSALALVNDYQKRLLSPVEVTQAALKRIAASKKVNAFVLVDAEKALSDASTLR